MEPKVQVDFFLRIYYGLVTVPSSSVNTVLDVQNFSKLYVQQMDWGTNIETIELSMLRFAHAYSRALLKYSIELNPNQIIQELQMNQTNLQCVLHWVAHIE